MDMKLHKAASSGDSDGVKTLLEKGADLNAPNVDFATPLSWAARNGHEEVVKLLLSKEGVDLDSYNIDDVTPLCWASRYGHAGVTGLLIARGAKYDSKDNNGHTPLWWATENSHSTVVKLLLEQGGVTMHTLVQRGERTQIRLLLSEGNVDSRNAFNQTPLHIAVLTRQTEIAGELISHGADINAEDGRSCTSLRLAIHQKSPDLINLLLKHSADPRGIEKREWLSAYGRQSLATVWLMESRADGPSVNIVTDREILEPIPLWKPERNKLIFDTESTLPWQKGSLKNVAAKLEISHDESPQGVRYFVTASLPISIAFYDGKNSSLPIGISWTMMPPAIPNGESSWKSITHLSVLPYGWIPDNGIEFFALFMAELEKRWSALCDETKTYLHTCRIDQLEKKGKTPELIDRLARLARNLAEIRNYLEDQFHEARPFSDDYRRRYNETVGVSEKGQATVNRCFENTTKKLDELDQTVRDLLQFASRLNVHIKRLHANNMQKFAWVSINESFKSTSTATSTKCLSWVTFIFLPAMFASSLFGMNVNMLKDNPDWRWYIAVVAASLLLTITAWLIFKYNPIETRIEELTHSFYQKLKGQHAVQPLKVHNETRTNLEKAQTGDANLLHEKSPV
ncbi:ankyrin repeat-containing domain protein [Fusarium oxysporum]|nr:ankyrin repeat-containing domain protein [Fusarium oxysporum]